MALQSKDWRSRRLRFHARDDVDDLFVDSGHGRNITADSIIALELRSRPQGTTWSGSLVQLGEGLIPIPNLFNFLIQSLAAQA